MQILDEGRITDAQGRTVNFENTVIIMTSNAGSNRREGALGFGKTKQDASQEKAMKALREFLRPEFIGRVDEIVVFRDLSQEALEKIAVLMLTELVEPLRDKGVKLTWAQDVPQTLAAMACDGERGARDLRNAVRRNVEDKIASILVNALDRSPKAMHISAMLGDIFVEAS